MNSTAGVVCLDHENHASPFCSIRGIVNYTPLMTNYIAVTLIELTTTEVPEVPKNKHSSENQSDDRNGKADRIIHYQVKSKIIAVPILSVLH